MADGDRTLTAQFGVDIAEDIPLGGNVATLSAPVVNGKVVMMSVLILLFSLWTYIRITENEPGSVRTARAR